MHTIDASRRHGEQIMVGVTANRRTHRYRSSLNLIGYRQALFVGFITEFDNLDHLGDHPVVML